MEVQVDPLQKIEDLKAKKFKKKEMINRLDRFLRKLRLF